MDKFDCFQLLLRQFRSHRYPIPLKMLAENLECSPKTVQRTIDQIIALLSGMLITRKCIQKNRPPLPEQKKGDEEWNNSLI